MSGGELVGMCGGGSHTGSSSFELNSATLHQPIHPSELNSRSESLKDNSHALYFIKSSILSQKFTHIKCPIYDHLLKFLLNILAHNNTLFIKNFLSLKYRHWLNLTQEECFFKWESKNKIRSLRSSQVPVQSSDISGFWPPEAPVPAA